MEAIRILSIIILVVFSMAAVLVWWKSRVIKAMKTTLEELYINEDNE